MKDIKPSKEFQEKLAEVPTDILLGDGARPYRQTGLSLGLQLLEYQQELIKLSEKSDDLKYNYRKKLEKETEQRPMTKDEAEKVKNKLVENRSEKYRTKGVYIKDADFNAISGLTMSEIIAGDDYVVFVTTDNRVFYMYHCQDCCENVYIEDVCGDWNDLIGSPILLAEEVESEDWPDGIEKKEDPESFTWTFYKIGTIHGVVTLRWYGESNGYYSESVDFCQCFIKQKYDDAYKESEAYRKVEDEIEAQVKKIQEFRREHNIVVM